MKNATINSVVFIAVFISCYFFVSEVLFRILNVPKDPCYCHFHSCPYWVEKFYMDESGHVDKSGNLFMLLMLILASAMFTTAFAFVRNSILKKLKS
jgi:hypothetical protein